MSLTFLATFVVVHQCRLLWPSYKNLFILHLSLLIDLVRTIYFHMHPPLLSASIFILFSPSPSLNNYLSAFSSLGNLVFQVLSRHFSQREQEVSLMWVQFIKLVVETDNLQSNFVVQRPRCSSA